MKFLKFLWGLLVGLFVDVHEFLDERKVFGVLFLTAALVSPFVVAPSTEILGSLILVGVALLLGIPIGSSVPIASGIKSLGLLDLITSYSNRGDPGRLFGALFLVAALVYVFAPLVLRDLVPTVVTLWVFEGAGVVLLFGAAMFDRPKTESP